MDKIKYFGIDPMNLDPSTLQMKFADRLHRHNIASYESLASELFKDLHRMTASPGEHVSPFPLITGTKTIYNHAKTMKKAAKNEPQLSLGRCQLILAETFGYRYWAALVKAVYTYYGQAEVLEAKRCAKSIYKDLQAQGTPRKMKHIFKELVNGMPALKPNNVD